MTATDTLTAPIYRQNYQRLEDLLGQPIPDLRSGVVYRLRAAGFMDPGAVEQMTHSRPRTTLDE